ncbi:MAG: hypothetical protein HZB13_05815 [Acidobacteria bacterium]|nr:hypothetical protein [Acidobacteriota bacterium]
MKSLVTALVLLAGPALADCVDGVRKLNAAEKKMFDEVAAAFSAALPQPPESWRLSSGSATPMETTPCRGEAPGTIPVATSMMFRYMNPPKARSFPQEEAEMKRLGDEITAMQVTPPELRKQINEVQARQSEKRRASMAADRAGNKDEARTLRGEADAISQEADKLRKDYLASIGAEVKKREARIKEIRSTLPDYSTEVFVAVTVNERKEVPAPGKGLNEDVYVWGSKTPVKGAATTVQNVVLRIKGWPDYRETIGGRIDMAKLGGLVK